MANWKRLTIAAAISAVVFDFISGKKLAHSPNAHVEDAIQDMIMCGKCRNAIRHGAVILLTEHMQNAHNWDEEIAALAVHKMFKRYDHNRRRKENENETIQHNSLITGAR